MDRGVGSALKRECGEVQDEWLRIPENFKEWKEGRLSASRRRILLTHWYAEAWERMLKKFNMVKVRIRLYHATQILNQMQMEGLCSNRMWNETEVQRRRQRDSIIRL